MVCRVTLSVIMMLGLAVPAAAADFGSLRIGMTEEDALRILKARGVPKSSPYNGASSTVPQTLIRIDAVNVLVCRARVVSITHKLTNNFATWAREMRVAIAERGQPTEWKVDNNEADPEVHSVHADWKRPGAVTYSISYTEVDRQVLVSESTTTGAPCRS